MLSGIRAEVAIKIYGDDLDILRSLAETLRTKVAGIDGMADLQVEKQVRIPQLRVDVDHERAALYGLTPASVTDALATLSNGRTVSQIIEGKPPLRRRHPPWGRGPLDHGLGDLLISTPAGRIPLRRVADVTEADGPNQISRENTQRRIAVFGNTDKRRDLAAVVADVRRAVDGTRWPAGYRVGLEGTFQAQEEASTRIGLLSLVALGLIFTVLFGRYRSVPLALIIMASIPLALIGSVAALWLSGQPLSVASMVGFITLAGITARNGILKISHYLNLALHEGETFGPALVVRGSLERLTPVLMTALSAGLALLPLVVGADEPGREILHPVAVTILGGLVSATVLDTLLTPVLFLAFGRKALERLQASRNGGLTPAEAF